MTAQVRPLTRAELDVAVSWAAQEGWDPGIGDADAFWAADPGGFWGAEMDGELLASLSLVRQSPDFGFFGFYIVRPEHRGEGLGQLLRTTVLDASPLRTIGLDGVLDQQENYARYGFELAYRTVRFAGVPARGDGGEEVVDALALDWERLVAFDAEHGPAPRPAFLEPWLRGGGRAAVAVPDGDGGLRGYGALRPSVAGHRVGPLFADGPATARSILLALAERAGGPVSVDVPGVNAAGVQLARDLGLEPSFETVRMYRGPDPGLPVARIFGGTSLELG